MTAQTSLPIDFLNNLQAELKDQGYRWNKRRSLGQFGDARHVYEVHNFNGPAHSGETLTVIIDVATLAIDRQYITRRPITR